MDADLPGAGAQVEVFEEPKTAQLGYVRVTLLPLIPCLEIFVFLSFSWHWQIIDIVHLCRRSGA